MSTNVFDIPVHPALETEKVPQIYQAMASIMRDTAAIGKNSFNEQQKFNYRSIDSVYNMLHVVLAKHGVFMTSEVIAKSREERTNQRGTVLAFTGLRMRYTFWAQDGSSVATEAEGEGMDAGDKSSNKAMAIAHKYALLQAFLIPTEEMRDPDAESFEVAKKPAGILLNTKPNPTAFTYEMDPDEKDAMRFDCVQAIQDAKTLEELRAAKAVARGFAMQCNDTAMWEMFKQQAADMAVVISEKDV